MKLRPEEISSIIKKEIENYGQKLESVGVGTVLDVGDGIAHVYGLKDAMSGELLEFPNDCLLYTSPSPRDRQKSRMPSSA